MTRLPWWKLVRRLNPVPTAAQVRGTVRGKLMRVVLLTTALAVSVASLAMLSHELYVYRTTWASDLSTEAAILASSTAPALAFDDHVVADRNLKALEARRRIMVAALYAADGSLYAAYVRQGEAPPPPSPPVEGVHASGARIEFGRVLRLNGEKLGTIYLRARYDVAGQLQLYVMIFGSVMLLSVAVALFFSHWLQRGLTEPLAAMARVARDIVSRRDYSLRAQKLTDDEIGVVVDAFNNMLEEVQRSNRALNSEILERQAAESALSRATARLESTMAAAEIGSWVWDIGTDRFTADRNLVSLFGLDDAHALDGAPGIHHGHVHPRDFAAVRDPESQAVTSGIFPSSEFRVLLPGGAERWMARRGKVQLDPDGKPLFVSGLMIDITAQKLAERALREADRRKDEFLATLAHELRNPLAPIRHAVKLLESTTLDASQSQWAREVIARQVQRMALLLDDLLDISRITRGRLELKLDTVALETLVVAAVETARPLIDSKQQHLSVQLPEAAVLLRVDPLRLSQALSNLLTNAAKYTDAKGHLELRITALEEGVSLRVADDGIGFEAAALPGMFEMFAQVDAAIDRAEGGLGIGLALVKGLMELHGGSVTGFSAGPGRGSEFTLHLPAACVVRRGAVVEAAPTAESSVPVAPLKVLVIDDNRDAADTLALLLELVGYEVLVGHSGGEALRLAADGRPDAIILDIGMPDMTGYEVACRLRAEPWGKGLFLVAVTGWGQKEDKARADVAGFDHHLTKPVDPDQIERLLRSRFDRGSPA